MYIYIYIFKQNKHERYMTLGPLNLFVCLISYCWFINFISSFVLCLRFYRIIMYHTANKLFFYQTLIIDKSISIIIVRTQNSYITPRVLCSTRKSWQNEKINKFEFYHKNRPIKVESCGKRLFLNEIPVL